MDQGSISIYISTSQTNRDVLNSGFQRSGQVVRVVYVNGEHQAVAFRLAEMATRIEAARLLVLHAARIIDSGASARGIAAMAKLTASETAMFVTHGAVQTLGGWGYSREYPVEQWMRDAKLEEIEEGTSDIMKLVISRNLG